MGTYKQNATVEAWAVRDLLAAAVRGENVPDIIEMYHNDGHLTFHPDRKAIKLKLRNGDEFLADERYVIIYNAGWFEVCLVEAFDEFYTLDVKETWSGAGWLGSEEINHRFGFHKAAIEGTAATTEEFARIRRLFIQVGGQLDRMIPAGREKTIAMDTLEDASMWFHKALARQNDLVEED
jgi:hypothetical protein